MRNKTFARKRFGQHFLSDESVIEAIVDALDLQQDDLVLEIGPGRGALTCYLLPQVKSLHAIELDRDLISYLPTAMSSYGTLHLHASDVLRFDFAAWYASLNDKRPVRLIGNLPYNISTPLLFHVFTANIPIRDMHFMLQKEVVDRMAAHAGDGAYGRLSLMTQYYAEVESLFLVPPEAFTPPPQVESAIVRLKPRRAYDLSPAEETLCFDLIRLLFSHRRKMVRAILKPYYPKLDWSALPLDPCARPECWSWPEFMLLARQIIQINRSA